MFLPTNYKVFTETKNQFGVPNFLWKYHIYNLNSTVVLIG